MSTQRTVRISCQQPTNVVCVVGTELLLDVYRCAPEGAVTFQVKNSPGVHIKYRQKNGATAVPRDLWPLDNGVEVLASMDLPSLNLKDQKMTVLYRCDKKDTPVSAAKIFFTGVVIALDIDTSRDGLVDRTKSDPSSWTWGNHGQGAILLVNCDREQTYVYRKDQDVYSDTDLGDMSQMTVRTKGPNTLFETHVVMLHITPAEDGKVRIFHDMSTGTGRSLKLALGEKKYVYQIERTSMQDNKFYVEGLTFPDQGFSGLVSIGVSLLDSTVEDLPDVPLFTRTAVFRMAPWIMTPNTLKPVEVYVCSTPDNEAFVKKLGELVSEAKAKLTVCPLAVNRGNRWMQEEMEFGYIDGPSKCFPVVLDSPRNRALNDFPIKMLGPEFGYWKREPIDGSIVNNLDSFGNLEVSPPVTVNGKQYPLGRIIFGGSLPTYAATYLTNCVTWAKENGILRFNFTNLVQINRFAGRRMNKVVQDFLYAQQVQAPVELYSDWLSVGHVDEFVTFVPTFSQKGFCMLMASPSACCQLFQDKQNKGHGDAAMFQGLGTEQRTINSILGDTALMNESKYAQSCIDWNRDILKKELGLEEKDIIDIPVLFHIPKADHKVSAFFPNLINMVVLGTILGLPKPFGPIIDGDCCLEQKVRSLLVPLGLKCNFIDDYTAYHMKQGEVHSGTNVRREPFQFKWWNMEA